ncbi:MAG: hypothetical protein FWD76_03155 [Firmicutes bacterium]|nr:hypothetical protein [Bacillota bacterium]
MSIERKNQGNTNKINYYLDLTEECNSLVYKQNLAYYHTLDGLIGMFFSLLTVEELKSLEGQVSRRAFAESVQPRIEHIEKLMCLDKKDESNFGNQKAIQEFLDSSKQFVTLFDNLKKTLDVYAKEIKITEEQKNFLLRGVEVNYTFVANNQRIGEKMLQCLQESNKNMCGDKKIEEEYKKSFTNTEVQQNSEKTGKQVWSGVGKAA